MNPIWSIKSDVKNDFVETLVDSILNNIINKELLDLRKKYLFEKTWVFDF